MTEAAPEWKPKHSPWWVMLSVLLATFMEVLDTSIANVALPHIAGNLSASGDESAWVLTSYLVANAIILPASGWLSVRFGRKRFLAVSVILFTVASAFCGLAQTLPQLVVARLLQGLGGGGLQPLAQAVLLESFPPEKRGMAMAGYGMAVVVAPILGPTFGGWLTDDFSWRWIFYINLPIGLLALFLQNHFLEDPPYLTRRPKGRIDGIGFGLMAIWIGTLQLVLDKGQEVDWFGATWVCWCVAGASAVFLFFVWWEWNEKEPIVNLRLLKNANFLTATILTTIIFSIIYGSNILLPQFMQNLLGYTALRSGEAMIPRGLGVFCSMLLVGNLMKRVENRLLIIGGLLSVGVTTWILGGLTLQITSSNIGWPLVFSGLGMGFVFVPLTTMSVATLRKDQIQGATGIYSLMRNLGSSVGISAVVSMQIRHSQMHQAILASHIGNNSVAFQDQLLHTQAALHALPTLQAHDLALKMFYHTLQNQASLISYLDIFRLLGLMSIACAPLVLVFRRSKPGAPPAAIAD